MATVVYVPCWVRLHGKAISAATFAMASTINHRAPKPICSASGAETARISASGTGVLGRCADYRLDTVQGLRGFGFRVRHLEGIAQFVRPALPSTAQIQVPEGC